MSELKGTIIPMENVSGSVDIFKECKDGESAYEIAVKNGFEGTEEEWLASLHGKDAVTDQGYSPESENAQSGVAVAEAIKDYDDSKKYEHIETIITTEEVSSVFRNKEPNGDSYKFSKMLFYCRFPQATGDGWLSIHIGFAMPSIASALKASRATSARSEIILDTATNQLTADFTEDINNTGNVKQVFYNTMYDYIWQADIQGSVSFPIGTEIQIYGVRYNEN